MSRWWHLTDDPNFAPRVDYVPADNALSIRQREAPGLYLASDVEPWVNGHGYRRPFVAEVEVDDQYLRRERWGGEMFLPAEHFDKARVIRVIPLDAYAREEYGSAGWLERDNERLFDTGEPYAEPSMFSSREDMYPFNGYRYPGDVRSLPSGEQQRLKSMASIREAGSRDDYGGMHSPPDPDDAAPLHDLSDLFVHDVYAPGEMRHYMHGDPPVPQESAATIMRARGNPEAMVTIYRSLPHDAPKEFNVGDWVALSRAYAEHHGMHPTDPEQDWPIISAQVPAKHVHFGGNDLVEWGYWGPPIPNARVAKRAEASLSTQASDDFLQSLDFDPYWGRSIDRHQYNYVAHMRLPDGTSIATMTVSSYQPDWDEPPEVQVEFIEVEPEYQRRGVGALLYRKMIEKIDKEHANWSPSDLQHSVQTGAGAALWRSVEPTLRAASAQQDTKRVYRGVSIGLATLDRLRDAETSEEMLHILGPVITRGGLHWSESRSYAKGFGKVLLVADMGRAEDGWWPRGGLNSGTYVVNDNRLLTLIDVEVNLGDGWTSLMGLSREASMLSWRPVGKSPSEWAQETDCLIVSDVRSRKMGRRYEVWVYGRLVGNRRLLEEAKDLAERQAKAATQSAEVEWKRQLVEPTMVTHYWWGDTDEFSDPLTVYLGNVTLGLTTTASYEELPEGRWTLDYISSPYYSPGGDFTSITAYARHETEPGLWPVGWLQWQEAHDPAVDSDDEEVWSNAKGDINGYYSEVVSLRVHPVARRQGIATALWQAFEEAHNNDPDMWDPGEFTPDGAAFWRGMGKGDVPSSKRMDSRWAAISHDPVVRIKEVLRPLQLLSDQMTRESLVALSRIEEGVAAFDAGADDLLYDRGEAARRVLAMYHGDDEPEEERALRRVLAAMADALRSMAHAPGYDSPKAHQIVDRLEARVDAVFSRTASVTDRAAGLLLLNVGRDGQTRFYLTKRSDVVDDYVGSWTCPGGAMESGESASQTAIREFGEETGVQIRMVDVESLGTFRDFSPDTGTTFTTVVAESPRTFTGLGSEEITDDGWFTLDEMRRLELHPGITRGMSDIRKFML